MGRRQSKRPRHPSQPKVEMSNQALAVGLLNSALTNLTATLVTLAAELDNAAQIFAEEQGTDGGRVGCKAALQAVVDFCDRAGLGPERRTPLMRLYNALVSAENGARDPLLNIKSRPNAPPLTEAAKRQRGLLAAAMEAQFRGGLTLDNAAKWVAARSKRMIAAQRGKATLWKQIKSWRVTASGGDVTRDPDTNAYRFACTMFDDGMPVGTPGAQAFLNLAEREGSI